MDSSPASLLAEHAAGSGFPAGSRFHLYGDARPDLGLPAASSPSPLTAREALTNPARVTLADVSGLAFLDAEAFVPGSLSSRLPAWREILRGQPDGERVLRWLEHGVSYTDFLSPFTGSFAGASYSSSEPPPRVFRNHPAAVSDEFLPFVRSEVSKGLANGGIQRLGRVGDVPPPRVVCPLGVEPSKPRLIVDARYPNLWQRPPTFSFDRLLDLARASEPGDLLSVWDHKSGYFHVRLAPDTVGLFGFELDGFYYAYTVLPFGWNVSPYVYQTISRCVSVYLRSLGVADFTYLDDTAAPSPPHLALSHSYVKGLLLSALGYFVELKKSHILPAPTQQWLGFSIDLVARVFRIPKAKLSKFLTLLDAIAASSSSVSVPTLRSFVGKCVSLSPAVPGALLYTRGLFNLLSRADAAGLDFVPVDAPAAAELACWRGLRSWHGTRRWRDERHVRVRAHAATDASDVRWGGWFQLLPADAAASASPPVLIGDVWSSEEAALDIGTREMLAGVRLLECLPPCVRDCILLLDGDNQAMIHLLRSERAAAGAHLLAAQRALFHLLLDRNITIDARWLASADNFLADAISRLPLSGEGCLSRSVFRRLELLRGAAFTIDAFAGPLNAQCPRFISWFHTPARSPVFGTVAAAVDFFAFLSFGAEPGVFAFPPEAVVSAAVAHLRAQRARGVLVTPWSPAAVWWPLVFRCAPRPPVLLAPAGDATTVVFPDGRPRPLRHPLYGVFFDFQ